MSNKSFIASILLLGFTLAVAAALSARGLPVVVKTNLENLPMQIGEYSATEDSFPQSVYEELNADKHVYRHYRAPDGRVIDLYIGYYGTAKGGRTGHNPYACLPGAGWGVVTDREVFLQSDNSREQVNYVVARKGYNYSVMLHWYQAAGSKVLGSGLEQNIHRFIGKVLYNKNDGAFVQVSAIVPKDQISRAKTDIKQFSEKILNLLPDYWPVEDQR